MKSLLAFIAIFSMNFALAASDVSDVDVDCSNIKLSQHIGYCATQEWLAMEPKREKLELKIIEFARRLDKEREGRGYDPKQYSINEKTTNESRVSFELYRKSECERQAAFPGPGSLTRAEYTKCHTLFTKRRIEALESSEKGFLRYFKSR